MNQGKNTFRLFKAGTLLVISAILLNFTPASGYNDSTASDKPASVGHKNISITAPSYRSVKNRLNLFKNMFAANPDQTSEILFRGIIKNGHFELGKNGNMDYVIKHRDGNTVKISESFAGGKTLINGIEKTSFPLNDLSGKNRSRLNLEYYEKISLGEVYNDIVVELRPSRGSIEKIITLEPGADPSDIIIDVNGHEELIIDKKGEIVITGNGAADGRAIHLSKPVAWQMRDAEKIKVETSYRIIDQNSYGFYVEEFDPSLPLIIDPILYSTFVGGETTNEYTSETHSADEIMVIAEDPSDSETYIYVTGYTGTGGDFPASFVPAATASERGTHDIFIAKLPLDLSEISAAALVGGNGSDLYSSITADSGGNIYVVFDTNSTDLPAGAGAFQTTFGGGSYDAAVMKLPPSLASISAATYLGGNYTDSAGNIDHSNGYVYVSGTTTNSGAGNTFPVAPTSGSDEVYNHSAGTTDREIFISRLDDDLSEAYYAGTFIQTKMTTPALAVNTVDANPDNDKILITGGTDSGLEIADPVNAYQSSFGGGLSDHFIARFNSRLTTLEASTFIGGGETANGVGSVDIYNNLGTYTVTITSDIADGSTFFAALRNDGNNRRYDYDENSGNGTLNGCAEDDLFAATFNYNLTEASVALFCGDDFDYNPRSAINSSGDIYIAANSDSSNFPVSPNAYMPEPAGYTDVVMMVLPNDLSSLTAATYLGGAESTDWYAKGLGFDASENLYVTGQTFSMDFPSTPGTARPYKTDSDSDYFVTAFSPDLASPCAPLSDNEDSDGAGPISAVSEACLGIKIDPGAAYFEHVPASFSFPAKYATAIAQSSFNNTALSSDDILTVRELGGNGGFDVTVQASSLTNGYETIPLSNLYIVSAAPGEANLNAIDPSLNGTTTGEQITYADGSIGQNITAGSATSGAIDYPATYLTDGHHFENGPVTIMSAATADHYLRASQALSFYLNIPANTTPGTYSTIFTIDLIQN